MSTSAPVTLTPEEQRTLGDIARHAIMRGLEQKNPVEGLSEPDSLTLNQPLGAFVTLNRRGRLRGCIGNMIGQGPLYVTVARMAYAAAFEDYRFPSLEQAEWPEIELDISVLGPMTRCPNPEKIEIGRHGLLLVRGNQSGVFLPQVPVEQHWDRLTYLQHLCGKAGLPPDSWKASDAELYWYEAFVFTPSSERR